MMPRQIRRLTRRSNKGKHVKAKLCTGLIVASILSMSAPVLCAATPPPTRSRARAESPAPSQVSSQQWRQMLSRMKVMREQMYRIHRAKTTAERDKLLREHMRTMLEQMQAMRAMGGSMMSEMMRGGMMGGRMTGGGMMGGAMAGGGTMGRATVSGSGSGSRSVTPADQKRWMQRRLDMMQLMMGQMMEQMQSMQVMGMGMSTRGK